MELYVKNAISMISFVSLAVGRRGRRGQGDRVTGFSKNENDPASWNFDSETILHAELVIPFRSHLNSRA